jgi:radical SAM protein with 4Fe4S-binding SPASM domain
MLAEGFWGLLETLHPRGWSFGVMTTGLMLDEVLVRKLAHLKPAFVQVSLDGDADAHDEIRGKGNHAQVISSIQLLAKAGLRTSVSFTALRSNARFLPSVMDAARKAGAATLWTDRFIPCGNADPLREEVMGPDEVDAWLKALGQCRRQSLRSPWRAIQIQTGRALQFRVSPEAPYQCKAGSTLLTLLPDGTLCPCRRMPIPVGNVLETPMVDLYDHSPLFQRLRDTRVPEACSGCAYGNHCQGGLRCLAWAVKGDPLAGDPGCSLLN